MLRMATQRAKDRSHPLPSLSMETCDHETRGHVVYSASTAAIAAAVHTVTHPMARRARRQSPPTYSLVEPHSPSRPTHGPRASIPAQHGRVPLRFAVPAKPEFATYLFLTAHQIKNTEAPIPLFQHRDTQAPLIAFSHLTPRATSHVGLPIFHHSASQHLSSGTTRKRGASSPSPPHQTTPSRYILSPGSPGSALWPPQPLNTQGGSP
jgi:hypothetical protein